MRIAELSPEIRARAVKLSGRYAHIHAVVPPDPPAQLDIRPAYEEVLKAVEWIGRLEAAAARLPNALLITRTLERREAVLSSQIEGTSATLSDLLAYEATGSEEGGPVDVVVTRNYVSALDHGLQRVRERGAAAFDLELIRELHRILMSKTDYRAKPGAFKLEPNWIGGGRGIEHASYVPAPPDQVEHCLEILNGYLQQDAVGPVLALPVRMAVAHAYFESVHPFPDGNGRVGRLIPPLMMAAEGHVPLYVAGYLIRHRDDYYDGLLGVQRHGEWMPWIQTFLRAVSASAAESIEIADKLVALRNGWNDRLAGLRRDSAAYKALDVLLSRPALTIGSLSKAAGVSFPAASSAIGAMVERGILVEKTGRRRDRLFEAAEVLEILNPGGVPEQQEA